jgi:DNA-binding IclR family transcriptional regulator
MSDSVDNKPYYFLGTLAKAVKVLDQFTKGESELTVTEVAHRTELPKSVVHRILATLLI